MSSLKVHILSLYFSNMSLALLRPKSSKCNKTLGNNLLETLTNSSINSSYFSPLDKPE